MGKNLEPREDNGLVPVTVTKAIVLHILWIVDPFENLMKAVILFQMFNRHNFTATLRGTGSHPKCTWGLMNWTVCWGPVTQQHVSSWHSMIIRGTCHCLWHLQVMNRLILTLRTPESLCLGLLYCAGWTHWEEMSGAVWPRLLLQCDPKCERGYLRPLPTAHRVPGVWKCWEGERHVSMMWPECACLGGLDSSSQGQEACSWAAQTHFP